VVEASGMMLKERKRECVNVFKCTIYQVDSIFKYSVTKAPSRVMFHSFESVVMIVN